MSTDHVSGSETGRVLRRVEIDQAKGVLMALYGVDDVEAFAMLSRQSQRRNIKIFELSVVLLEAVRSSASVDASSDAERDLSAHVDSLLRSRALAAVVASADVSPVRPPAPGPGGVRVAP